MSDAKPASRYTLEWFKSFVRPVLQKTDSAPAVDELNKLASQVVELEKNRGELFPICLLGQAGVGKSTLINTLIADTDIVVPSGGGTGPLTANALRVVYGETPSFAVRYHTKKQLDYTRLTLESEIQRRSKSTVAPSELNPNEDPEILEIELDGEEQKKTRTDEAIGQACLLVANSQNAQRELTYLADALRSVLGQASKFQSKITEEDQSRLGDIQEALKHSTNDTARHFKSVGNPEFGHRLRDHACGFLAPLILNMSIQWPSPLLRDSVELIDLPGIGILSDAYASVTSDYLRNRAKAVMLVADSRGLRREDAELLRTSGFLSRLLHASDDPTADPVALIVVVVKIDDVAVENWRNDKAVNSVVRKSKAEHFAEQVENSSKVIAKRLETFLREVWEDDTEAKRDVIRSIVDNLQVFPVSAPQFRLFCSNDPDEDRPFLPNAESTNIFALREAISKIAKQCLAEQNRRLEETHHRFFGQLRARLKVLSAQRAEERQAEEEIARFKQSLDEFIAPLQREFDTRRGGFRNFLRKTIPAKIEDKVKAASGKARKSINSDLKKLESANWRTLQAAVRKEGTFYGKRHINLPHDFALRFEEPVAEIWSREILVDVRRETRSFAEYQSTAVDGVLEWARKQGIRRSTRLLEALVESVQQHRQQVDAVGKEAVDVLRAKVRSELIKRIEAPIRNKCRKFVSEQKDFGTGVKARILALFEQLVDDVIDVAEGPAVSLLVTQFKEVDKEILAAFRDHSEPISDAADALVQRQEKNLGVKDPLAEKLGVEIDAALAAMPSETGSSEESPP